MKRKKGAKKSIESLKKRIKEHEDKLEEARREDRVELVDYYEKELISLKKFMDKKKGILER